MNGTRHIKFGKMPCSGVEFRRQEQNENTADKAPKASRNNNNHTQKKS